MIPSRIKRPSTAAVPANLSQVARTLDVFAVFARFAAR